MKRYTILVAALFGLAVGLPSAQAAVIMADKFDTYADQAAFQAAWPIAPGATSSADLSTAQSKSPPNSIEVDGNAATNNLQRNQRTFAETGNPSPTQNIMWSFDFYDSNGAASPYRQYSNLQDGTANATNMLISMGLNNNKTVGDSGGNYYMARILGYTTTANPDPDGGPVEGGTLGAGAYFKLNDFGVGLRSTGWHNLRVVLSSNDGASTDYDFYVDGVLAERVHNVGAAASIRSYDHIRIGSGFSNGNNAAYYDNMRLQTGTQLLIPEPTSLALVGLSVFGIALAGRRRSS